ncbi:cellulose biosynthesis cyclic di-GMP-binding regulatory protein BcsB [Metasolibacillus meyeri]|uniref:Cellulose biosynthesis cyclic di-GMP-binding regulatory protein BcsB n=1 Tax=Metasolibacillus meyeri TaxID=1071052 RepID=A0AAW9NMR6_9BACL|nr:cellulose biosynthesis cyclic di-GMP-binding regulatory protein BcsB [Metasolibacillus meyeri]MEC1178695.1 cellulose biosynthesis cyclic di-GMP-binding regulatory protein BcsB [Metasolibacillus meyeri]
MRKIIYLVTLAIALLFYSEQVVAATIVVDKERLQIEVNEAPKKPLVTRSTELQGTEVSRDFYYTITEDIVHDRTYEVIFHVRHSKLLIDPSSFTVKVDDSAVKTIPLRQDKLSQSVTVQLSKEALTKGTHKITASFYGIVKEGVCVAPGNAGSWLRIDPLSSISLFDKAEKAWTLADYPNAFLSYEDSQTTLIVPNQASLTTINQAYQLAAYLSEHSEQDVRIVKESDREIVRGSVIVVGGQAEFSEAYILDVLKDTEGAEATLRILTLENSDSTYSVPALFVTAKEIDHLQKGVTLLTTEHLYSQLVGEVFQVSDLPVLDKLQTSEITFEQFGFNTQTLSSQVASTSTYYIALPQLQSEQEAALKLILKKSATLSEEIERETELIVTINDVPHAVDIQKLKETSTDIYEVTIPVATNTLNKSKLTAIQFEVTGFQLEDPCETTNERYWLYIDAASSLTIPKQEGALTFTLMDFPRAFYHNALIVVPNEKTVRVDEMVQLYKSLMINGQSADIRLVQEQEISEEDLQNYALIFVGAVEDFSMLTTHTNSILYTEADFLKQGLLYQAMSDYAFITRSFWQENQPFMLLQVADTPPMNASFLEQLRQVNQPVNMVMLTKEGQLITGKQEQQATEMNEVEQSSIIWQAIAVFVLFVLLIVVIIYVLLKRRKKRYLTEEKND